MLTVYVLENGVVDITSFFSISTQNFFNPPFRVVLCRIRQCFCSSTIRFEHIFVINKQFRTCANGFHEWVQSGRMNIERVNIGFFTGCKKIKQRRISFVLGYLRMILRKMSTPISIKHRILATFRINKKSLLTACMPLNMTFFLQVSCEKYWLPSTSTRVRPLYFCGVGVAHLYSFLCCGVFLFLFVFILCRVWPMLLDSLDCLFSIPPSVFSIVLYAQISYR